MELPASIKKGLYENLWTDGLCELNILIFDNPAC